MTVAGAIRRRRASRPHLPLFVLVLLFSTLTPRTSALRVPLRHAATLVSLSHSLLSCAAITRVARGDAAAAARVRRIASLLSSRGAWGLGWDYLRHYAFSSAIGCGLSCAVAASRLIAAVAQASRLRSATDAAQWMRLHYDDICDVATQLLNGLLLAFSEEGPLREVFMDIKWEVEEGELLKDCLEVGAKDLKGLLVIAKDLFAGVSRTSTQHSEL
ncbi:uncharacterized protein [Zea mays]|uniref:Uncharacterized protein n=1 Tax=Zea mays TaxID=4577 RepID=A0A1D6KTI2_MAIZE|nr:uncharacterized protein LOC103643459 [Zea mays]ONM05897.1 hypothetical protein ZEAMMB73_Zm00001d032709 [Zea mays]|eukprot:XP_008664882.1 uncharacterized protein LOC103643459 [Zea mays]